MYVNVTGLFALFVLLFLTFDADAQDLPAVEFDFGERLLPTNVSATAHATTLFISEPFNDKYYQWAQFDGIPSEETKRDLAVKGVEFLEYVKTHCYLLAIPSNMSPAELSAAGIKSTIELNLESKMDSRIINQDIPAYAKVQDCILLKMMTMPHVNLDVLQSEISALGGFDIQRPHHERFVFLSASREDAIRLSRLPWVRYVELMDPKGEPESVEGRGMQKANVIDNHLTGAGALSYNGDGVRVLVRDDGDVGPHIDFHGRLWNDPQNGSSGTHGDGVAGVWGACGNLDPTIVAGGSAADVYVIDYLSTFLDNTLALHVDSGIVITNSSYSNGCNVGYTSTTQTVDEHIYDHPTLVHVFSAGNSNGSDCGYGAGNQWGNITGGHKQGKNVIAVANLFRDASLVTSSSRGPAYDGRIKPDMAGHGQGQISTNPNQGYQSFGGTSAAAPSTAGNLTQLYHVHRDLYGTTPPSALIKACAMNSAHDLGNVGPDFKYGWGLIHAGHAYDILANNQFLSSTIADGGSNTHNIVVPSGIGELRIMVYWSDPEASVSALTALINDIDMTVYDPGAANHLPYLLDHTPNPVNLDLPAGNGADHLNNVEQVAITSPTAGTYTVNINGFSIPQGPQEYFIVYSFIPTGVKVTYPLGGEKLVQNVVERLQWDAFGNSGTFTAEYSTNNGSTWNLIVAGIAADQRSVDWIPPVVVSGSCLVRVTRGAESDTSDETFNIHDVVEELTSVTIGVDTASLSWMSVTGATSYNIYQLGSKKMELVGTTTDTSFKAGNLTTALTYWFSVSANTLPAEGQRSLAIVHTQDVASVCNSCLISTQLPQIESFENGFGNHCNFENDDFNWRLWSGPTPSSGTGPSSAFEGSQYVYVEATNPNFPSMSTLLGGPCIDMNSCTNAYIQFYYHMFGVAMGALELQASTDQGTTWPTVIWNMAGDQGDQWHEVYIDLSSFCGGDFNYRFVAVTGTDFTSDMAIDDIKVIEGILCRAPSNLSFVSVTDTTATVNWSASSNALKYDLELVNTTAGGSQIGLATVSDIVDINYTFIDLLALTMYDVYVRSQCSEDSSGWVGPLSITTTGCIENLPWLDPLESYALCSDLSGPVACDFGSGWTQDQLDGNDWRIHAGGTVSVETGPVVDHTLGTVSGQYLYVESSAPFNMISNLHSPCIDLDGLSSPLLEFYYHMYGIDIGTLNVDISTNGDTTWANLWTLSGQVQSTHTDPWLFASIDLSSYSGRVLIRFQGIAGSNFHSDMAIDDINIRDNDCVPSLTVNGIPASGIYFASGVVTSYALITNPNTVIFSGGGGVDLLSEFEVEVGAEFEANIDGCP